MGEQSVATFLVTSPNDGELGPRLLTIFSTTDTLHLLHRQSLHACRSDEDPMELAGVATINYSCQAQHRCLVDHR